MKLADARRRIHELSRGSGEPADDSEMLALLEPFERAGLRPLVGADDAVRRFLYDGCVRFDRWSVPTPIMLAPAAVESFQRFLAAFQVAERADSDNMPTLRLHELQRQLYELAAVTTPAGRSAPVDPPR